MALTYTGGRDLYGKFSQDTSTTNLLFGDTLINQAIREILGSKDWPFLRKSATDTSVASQQFYELPNDCIKLINVTLTVSTTKYQPKEAPSRQFWDALNQSTSQQSDTPEWFFVIGKTVGFWPTLSSSGNTITYNFKKRIPTLSIADFSTGTVDIATNGDETITGSGTSWTSPMADRYLKITPSNVAASSGDGQWYEINSITSGTILELVKKYEGISLTTGAAAAYAIGQFPPLPEEYHILPIYRAAQLYWLPKDEKRNREFAKLYNEMLFQFKQDYQSETTSPVIDDGGPRQIINPNLTVEL